MRCAVFRAGHTPILPLPAPDTNQLAGGPRGSTSSESSRDASCPGAASSATTASCNRQDSPVRPDRSDYPALRNLAGSVGPEDGDLHHL